MMLEHLKALFLGFTLTVLALLALIAGITWLVSVAHPVASIKVVLGQSDDASPEFAAESVRTAWAASDGVLRLSVLRERFPLRSMEWEFQQDLAQSPSLLGEPSRSWFDGAPWLRMPTTRVEWFGVEYVAVDTRVRDGYALALPLGRVAVVSVAVALVGVLAMLHRFRRKKRIGFPIQPNEAAEGRETSPRDRTAVRGRR